jgi:chromosome partitioning protein
MSNTTTPSCSLDDIDELSGIAGDFLAHIRQQLYAPGAHKRGPQYTMSQLAQFIGKDKAALSKRLSSATKEMPTGELVGSQRLFTVEDIRAWARYYKRCHVRHGLERGAVIAVANFKGGVSKTTTTAHLAQGLSLKGYRVLLIDLDAQGSLTNLMGINPEFDVEVEDTIVPLTSGEQDSLKPSIRSTYWSGVDIVPGSVVLNNADFYLPARQSRDPGFAFWDVLRRALHSDGLLETYDYVIIDTPPAISYTTINAFLAADCLLVPMPPEGQDFASAVQFWTLFSQLAKGIDKHLKEEDRKTYAWIRVVPTKVDRTRAHSAIVLDWMKSVYRHYLSSTEIPITSAVSVSGIQLGTIYDISRYTGSSRTYLRARQAYDRLVDEVDQLTRLHFWGPK